jgi:hypothetical protein
MKPTYEELEQIVQAQAKELCNQAQEIRNLMAECTRLKNMLERLEARLGKNSKNSSKPPSSDTKPNASPKNKEDSKSHHPGVGRTLLPEDKVTSREQRRVEQCPRCRSLMEPTGNSTKWQQVELPEIKPLVHEIELLTCRCTRCALTATPTLADSEQFLMGPRLEGFVNLLMAQFRHSHQSVRRFISLLIPGLQLSQGLISKTKARSAAAFDIAIETLWQDICTSTETKFADCTGWRHLGKNHHALILRTPSLLRYFILAKQNGATLQDILGPGPHHLVSDRGLPTQLVPSASHQYCLAHFLRNIQGVAEDPRVSLEETQELGLIHETLKGLFHDQHQVVRGELKSSTCRKYGYNKWAWMRETFNRLLSITSSSLLRRFCKKALKDWKRFMTYLVREGPMTNNLAEEGLRNLVIARKLCFGSRSVYGMKWREAMHSCIETLSRQGKSVLDFFTETIHAARTGSSCPTIV